MTVNLFRGRNVPLVAMCALALSATLGIGVLVAFGGQIPSPFTTLFFIPIALIAYRRPLPSALVIAGLASLFSSPAMGIIGVAVDGSVMPVLWLGWPAV